MSVRLTTRVRIDQRIETHVLTVLMNMCFFTSLVSQKLIVDSTRDLAATDVSPRVIICANFSLDLSRNHNAE